MIEGINEGEKNIRTQREKERKRERCHNNISEIKGEIQGKKNL